MPRNSRPNGEFKKVICEGLTLQTPTGEPRLEITSLSSGVLLTCKSVKHSTPPYSVIISMHDDELVCRIKHGKGQLIFGFDQQGQIQLRNEPDEKPSSV